MRKAAEDVESGKPVFSGWVDLRADPGPLRYDDRGQHRIEVSGPGLSMNLARTLGDWHQSDPRLVVVLGEPTLHGAPARAADLIDVLDRPSNAPLAIGGRFSLVAVNFETKVVRLQTDRFGVWPICWSREGYRLSFSDRADGVPTAGRKTLDPQALFDYVYFHVIPAPRTVFRGISRLEPCTELEFSENGASVRRTWDTQFSRTRKDSLKHLAKRFRQTLRDVVAREASGRKVGCFLSGGTDSSTVAGVLKETTGRAASFSIGFDESGYDEMAYARIAARHFGTDHHEHYVSPAELVTAIPLVAAHYDQPFGNSSAVPAFICARLARESGIDKLLAGDGGDELFGGNSRYAKQKVFEAWASVPQPLRQALAVSFGNSLVRRLPLLRKGASYIEQASVPMPARLETYNLLERVGPKNVFRPEILDLVDATAPARLQAEVYGRHASAPFIDRMLAYDWRFTLADNDLPKVRGTAQLARVDVGFPLLSDSLVDLSTELSPGDKVHGLKLRYFFKQCLKGFLPEEIIRKKKHGFGLPVGRWLVSDVRFRTLALDSIAQLSRRGIVHERLVDELFARRLEEHAGYHGEMAWVLMMLEQWLSSRSETLSI